MTTSRLALALLLSAPLAVGAQDDPRESMLEQVRAAQSRMDSDVGEARHKHREDVDELSARMRTQYEQMVRRMVEERERLRRRVALQWDSFHESTTKEWVDYSDRGDAMSRVDFDKGSIEIEVLVPVEQRGTLDAVATEKIAEQAKKVLAQKDARGAPAVKDQVKAPDGAPVTEETAARFVKTAVAPRLIVDDKPVLGEDGKPRLKVKARIEMVPDHLKIRAKQHQARVADVSKKYGLDPALVLAVIHTESCFNPRARSQAPAFGLMQLMQRSGAREAYKFLYNEDKILDPEYLYDPELNILLGATYLHMLQQRHFGKIKNPDNRRTLSIAAYNCGPGCVKRSILSKYDADSMTNEELTALIRRVVPKETQEYVPRVQERIELYRRL